MQLDRKGGARTVNTLHFDRTSHHLQEIGRNGESETGSFNRTILLDIQSLELFKQFGLFLFPDSHTGIDHITGQHHMVALRIAAADAKFDTAFFGIFHRIVQEVDQDLSQPHFIPIEALRKIRIQIQF